MKRCITATFALGIMALVSSAQYHRPLGIISDIIAGINAKLGCGGHIFPFAKKLSMNDTETSETEEDDCFIGLNAKWLFYQMGQLDDKHHDVRVAYQQAAEKNNFDKILLNEMLAAQGESQSNIHLAIVNHALIPRGFNLGGRCMIRLKDSILFFHRLKLRDQTTFRVDYLHSDLEDMTLTAKLTLHDLHLFGSYDRALTQANEPSNLFYRPTFGEVDILLKDAQYYMEGRYRLLKDQLVIELIISKLLVSEVVLMYKPNNTCDNTILKIEIERVDPLLRSIGTNLEIWLRRYFNDYLTYFGVAGVVASEEYQQYGLLKTSTLNIYVDQALETLREKMRKHKVTCFLVPGFTIYTINGMIIRLRNGKLRGLETIHRSSMATGRKVNNVRYVDAMISFGNLRLVYEYEAIISEDLPPVTGLFVLSCDHLTAKMGMSVVENPETAHIGIEFFELNSEETLTVEGPIIRMIANFKHVLEHEIMTLMYNTLVHHVSLLGKLSKCDPDLPGPCTDGDVSVEDPGKPEANKTTPCVCPPTEKPEKQDWESYYNDVDGSSEGRGANNNINRKGAAIGGPKANQKANIRIRNRRKYMPV